MTFKGLIAFADNSEFVINWNYLISASFDWINVPLLSHYSQQLDVWQPSAKGCLHLRLQHLYRRHVQSIVLSCWCKLQRQQEPGPSVSFYYVDWCHSGPIIEQARQSICDATTNSNLRSKSKTTVKTPNTLLHHSTTPPRRHNKHLHSEQRFSALYFILLSRWTSTYRQQQNLCDF